MSRKILTVTPNAALDHWISTKRLRDGPKLRSAPPKLDPGGGGINVSRVLHRLGADTRALYAAGGYTAIPIAAGLDRENVPSECVDVDGDTRENISIMEEETDKVFRLVMPGPRLSDDELTAILDRMSELAADSAMVVGSGSLPRDTRESFWAEAASRVRDAGSKFVLDSSSHARPALEEGLFLLRENHDEIVKIAGKDMSWPAEIADWASDRIERGAVEIVVVTNADQGALMVTRDRRIRVTPPDVSVHSAIGAGDSFVAGLCQGLSRERPPEQVLKLAVAAAAATLLTPGTELCRKEDVERLVEECGEPETL